MNAKTENIYTQANWKLFLETYFPDAKSDNARYELLSEIIGIGAASIKNQSSPGKEELPTWARACIYGMLSVPKVSADVAEIEKEVKRKMVEHLNKFIE